MSDDQFEKPKEVMNEQTGLPERTDEERDKGERGGKIGAVILPLVPTAIGYGLAYLIYRYGDKTKYDGRITLAKDNDAQWALLGLILFSLTVAWLNVYPLRFKERFMGGGNLRANMYIYKQATDVDGTGPAVVLNTEGDIGCYNRGNRSLHHFLENGLGFVASLPFSFFLFPLPSFILVCTYCFGRIAHQVGYANYGFGGHGIGFLFDKLSSSIVLGLLIVAYTKMVF